MKEFFSYFKDEFIQNKKLVINVLILGILILGIPLGIQLARNQQIFSSRAAGETIEFVDGECVKKVDGNIVTTCTTVPIQLNVPPKQAADASFNLVSKVQAAGEEIGDGCSSSNNYITIGNKTVTKCENKCISVKTDQGQIGFCNNASPAQVADGSYLDQITQGWYCNEDKSAIIRKFNNQYTITHQTCPNNTCRALSNTANGLPDADCNGTPQTTSAPADPPKSLTATAWRCGDGSAQAPNKNAIYQVNSDGSRTPHSVCPAGTCGNFYNETAKKNDAGCIKGWKCDASKTKIVQYYSDTQTSSLHESCPKERSVCQDGIKINGYEQDARCVAAGTPPITQTQGQAGSAGTRIEQKCQINSSGTVLNGSYWLDTVTKIKYPSKDATSPLTTECQVTVVGAPRPVGSASTSSSAGGSVSPSFGNLTDKTCKGETKSYDQMLSELKSANYNGALDQGSILAAYNRTVCPTAPSDCKSNPPMGIDPVTGKDRGSRPEGYMWEASCTRACLYNDQKTPDDPAGCPKNTSDFYVNPATSNWCYGFEGGNRCLMLKFVGNQYRIAEDLNTLNNKPFVPYDAGAIINFAFANDNPGTKFIYLQFKDEKGNITNANPFPAKIEKVSALPSGTNNSSTSATTCPVTASCCEAKLTKCTTGPKNTTECKTPGFQWCYKGVCINENYSEVAKACAI